MLKILIFTMLSTLAFGAQAQSEDDYAKAVCSVIAENYARGEVSGMYGPGDRRSVHTTYSQFFKVSDDEYFVAVDVTYFEDFLIQNSEPVYFACYRCDDGLLRVSKENRETACQ